MRQWEIVWVLAAGVVLPFLHQFTEVLYLFFKRVDGLLSLILWKIRQEEGMALHELQPFPTNPSIH